jgi:hypothetical protein
MYCIKLAISIGKKDEGCNNGDRKCCDSINSGHVVVPKAWIGKEAIVTLKEKGGKKGK